ncbi:MAG TPA: acyltransferase [Holophagaceae bacterium]|nr:acyltransferase [Holophagaceae bacterium]
MSRPPSQIPALDGVRAIAAVMVMVFHYWQSGGFDALPLVHRVSRVALFGQTGVDLFFVLSGFLITRILIATRENPGYFRIFYARRTLRILPLYYFFLVLFYFVAPWLQHQPVAPFRETWWYWCYLQNIPQTFRTLASAGPIHYWSLAVEEHFYLIWPLLVYLTPTRWLARVSGGLIVLAILFRAVFLYHLHVSAFYFTLCRMDALAFGTLLACLEATDRLGAQKRRFAWILAIMPLVLVVAWTRVTGTGLDLVQLVKFSLEALVYAALIGMVVLKGGSGWVQRVFGHPALSFTGRISYGLYVYHELCFVMVAAIPFAMRHPLLRLPLSFGVAFLVSWASFQLLENPVLNLKKYFGYQRPSAA